MDKARKNLNENGFSLIELVIVIAVLAILSAVAIPTFTGVMRRARQAAAIAYVDATIKSGLVFNSENDRWPNTWEEFAQNSNSIDANVLESCQRYNSQCSGNQRPIVGGQYLIEFYTRSDELRVSAWRFNNTGATSRNRSVWGCMNLYRGGQIYHWNTDNYYQGAAWSGTIYDDNGAALSMCGQNP